MAVKFYLPYQFNLSTSYPPEALVERLNQYVEPFKIRWMFSYNHAPYQGTVTAHEFNITRIIHYRNSFLPRIRGQIEATSTGSLVKVSLNLHPMILPFLGLWFVGWYGAVLLINPMSVMPAPMGLFFFIMPLLLLMALVLSFWYEATRSRQDLEHIIQSNLEQVEQHFQKRHQARHKFRILQILMFIPGIVLGIWMITSGGL